MWHTEWPYRYLNARAYPMVLGSTIGPSADYQYEIFEKLGFGASSTVWLGWGKGKKNNDQWSAIKIPGANESDAATEVAVVKRLRDCVTYLCLPLKLAGTPISRILRRPLYFEERLELAIDAVDIMEKMHNEGYIISRTWRADFSGSNLLLKLRNEVHTYSQTQMRQSLGDSRDEDVSVTDGYSSNPVEIPYPVPHKVYRSPWLYRLTEQPFKLQVIDVNQGMWNSMLHCTKNTNVTPFRPFRTKHHVCLCLPEVLSTNEVSTESSIWGLGVLVGLHPIQICQIMTGRTPFGDYTRTLISIEHKRFFESTTNEQLRILRECTEYTRDYDGTLLYPDDESHETHPLVELLHNIFMKKLTVTEIKDWLLSMRALGEYWSEEDEYYSSAGGEEEEQVESAADVSSYENDEAFSDTGNSGTPA
ncbi:CMGC SRPK kinase protein [Rutstroemia sp. NJR-2017a BVV2]|nr:CMGC SRPK kinase protein [Rutstroemia sp. NJR-2017a BVV2]